MPDVAGIFAVGAILLTLIGGVAGNVLTMLVSRYREGKTQNIESADLVIGFLAALLIVITFLAFFPVLVINVVWNNNQILFLCIGILFGILGSIAANFFSHYYNNWIDSRKTATGPFRLNKDAKGTLLMLGVIIVLLAYLFWLFEQFV